MLKIKDNISDLLSLLINSITILYFTMFQSSIYLQNWMNIYEIIAWIMAILLTVGFFGTSYAFQKLIDSEVDNKVLSEKLEEFQSNLEKNKEILPTIIRYWYYLAILTIGVIGGDLSLFFPCLVSALYVAGIKKAFSIKIAEIEEKLLKGI